MSKHSESNRRSFLKQLGAAGAGAVAFSYAQPASVFGAAANNRLNLALIGCGNRMRQLLQSIVSAGDNVVALCDADPAQLEKLRREASSRAWAKGAGLEKAKIYEDYRKLLAVEKSVDAVVIASGQRWHVPMSKAALVAGKHVFCEKPLAHSVAECREIRELAGRSNLATQVGTQGGSSATFRRSMEVIQAGVLGQIREVHCWIDRTFPPSAALATESDALPEGLNWDLWCGPSPMVPFKSYYLGGCLRWGRWLVFGDGHLADMGAHAINLPWRALKLGVPQRVSVKTAEPLKDSYPSATDFRWDFAARDKFSPVTVWWHDGPNAGPPDALGKELLSTYDHVPTNGVLFAGEKGLLCSDAWGVRGLVKLKNESEAQGVLEHPACQAVPKTMPKAPQNHMREWLDACKGGPPTFQGFVSSADIAEVGMVGMVALRSGKSIEWDANTMKAKGEPGADSFIHLEQRKKWL